jgi:outer membrane protein OmpA-like peptidoglycan-associated protein
VDAKDGCVSEPGPVENRGCPDGDRDGDTVVDRLDNCPDVAGTVENQGCKKKQLVVITQNQIQILDKVFFQTGKSKVRNRSRTLLNNVADVLKAHPEIKSIRVEGHTDNVGQAEKNKTLSQQRAESVVAYLIKRGVSADRLEGVGHGQERPIADNAVKTGRDQNRRVEFNIVNDTK